MARILVIGGSGFVGRRLAQTLVRDGHNVRCLARDPARVGDLAEMGCEVVKGDIADLESVQQAMEGVQAAYISIHTLGRQRADAGQRFMDIEKRGIQNVMAASRAHGNRRIVYVTSIGITQHSVSEWVRERGLIEEMLLTSGLDATVIGPGQIVGRGGRGFDNLVNQASRSVAFVLAGGMKVNAIALDDLVYYLIGIREEPRTFGQRYDVGRDEIMSVRQMIDVTAEVLGRRHPFKIEMPLGLLAWLAPVIERIAKTSPGAIRGLLDSVQGDASIDATPIRKILPRSLLSFREAATRALASQ